MITPQQHAEVLGRGGDMLADALGRAVAALEAGREYTPDEMAKVRHGIVTWHRIRHKAQREARA